MSREASRLTSLPHVAAPCAPAERSPGKPMPPIGVSYEILGTPQVGQPLEIRIRAQPEPGTEGFQIDVQGEASLVIAPLPQQTSSAEAGARHVRTVTVTPLQEGVFHLTVLAHGQRNGLRQARTISIPIRVGSAERTRAPAGTLKTDASGMRMIVLPGEHRP